MKNGMLKYCLSNPHQKRTQWETVRRSDLRTVVFAEGHHILVTTKYGHHFRVGLAHEQSLRNFIINGEDITIEESVPEKTGTEDFKLHPVRKRI